MKQDDIPWAFLDEYRGKAFSGEWPTLPEMFRITVSRHGERPCFTVFEGGRVSLSYREALSRVEAVSRWLREEGVEAGDRVAVTGKNAPEWAVAYLGILFAGAVVVPLDYQLKNEDTDALLKASGAKMLFVDEEKFSYYNEKSFQKGSLEEIVSLKKGLGTYIYDLDGPDAAIAPSSEHDLAAILFTSGTTGNPKGVMLSHQNLVSDCYLAQGTPLVVLSTDVFYAILPIHHAYTMLAVFIETISVGAEVVFGKKMITSIMLRELKEGRVTMLLGVPLLFNKLLAGILQGVRAKGPFVYGLVRGLMIVSGLIKKIVKVNPGKALFHSVLEKASLSTIRICICGGGPLAPAVFRQFNQLGIDFVQGYGLTETSPIINLNPKEHYKEESVGKVIPHIEMKILNPDERGVGEVVVRGPVVMKGYYGLPEDTKAAFTGDGFFKTGDLGYLDNENFLYLTGRAKNVIVTEGGKNVYPEEIENEFQLYTEIDQILVRGFQMDRKLNREGIEALVYPNPDFFKGDAGIAGKDEIRARIDSVIFRVNQKLLPYQKISRLTILDAPMEMTTTKKIKRDAV